MSDSAMEVESELSVQFMVGQWESVSRATFFEQREVEFMAFATKDVPGHFHVAVSRNVYGSRQRGLAEREAERPTA